LTDDGRAGFQTLSGSKKEIGASSGKLAAIRTFYKV
jgi:hypothetical protein